MGFNSGFKGLSHTVDIPTLQCSYVRESFFWCTLSSTLRWSLTYKNLSVNSFDFFLFHTDFVYCESFFCTCPFVYCRLIFGGPSLSKAHKMSFLRSHISSLANLHTLNTECLYTSTWIRYVLKGSQYLHHSSNSFSDWNATHTELF